MTKLEQEMYNDLQKVRKKAEDVLDEVEEYIEYASVIIAIFKKHMIKTDNGLKLEIFKEDKEDYELVNSWYCNKRL